MAYLNHEIEDITPSSTLLMDETAIYFEDSRTKTVDIVGRRHVVLKSTGFSSMRMGYWG